MRLRSFMVLGVILPAACQTAPEAPPTSGYVGIERVEVFAKGME